MCARACIHALGMVRMFGVRVFVVRMFDVLLFVVQTFANSGLQNVYKTDANSRAKVCQVGVYSSVRKSKEPTDLEVSTMLEYTNEFAVSVSLINYINSGIELYAQLEDNYIECTHDRKNANRCYNYRCALIELSIEIDRITSKHYDNISVYDILASESLVWHMQNFIGKKIDYIMSFGFHYVMRDSARLRNQFHMYKSVYEHINRMCKAYNVYC